ncbi:tRNA-splicing endonuclease subunit Sen15-like isoform X1 [Myxocyprinus asiaticus]|uniref:tRNA-splicing endonuclease subunit Sen15-like isoform X1 n=2 Tax=Myxocyprinus asiaticus TaxID=70543 RepID=UPI0022231408|nr:tRNA-splicing endonuclease subunit Sen15-like isoform X1 [Myxocyprinus asiaticus]
MNKENSRRRRNIMMDEANRADPPNWIQQHAVYQDLMRFNVGDSAQVHAAFLVYMDLTEVRGWSDVAGVSCPELHAVLLEAREKEGDTVQMIYPLPSHRSIKHRELRCILDRGAPMLLCSVASDSSLVYQRLCDGFLTPDPPVDIKDQGRRQHRKRRLQT